MNIFTEEQYIGRNSKIKIKTISQNVDGKETLWGFTKDFIAERTPDGCVRMYTPSGDSYVSIANIKSDSNNHVDGGNLGLN